MKTFAGAAIAGLIAAATVAATPALAGGPPKYGYGAKPGYGQGYAQGYNRGYNNGNRNNNGWGTGFATGAVLGLGLGVIATAPRPAPYPAPAYYYPPPPRVYYAPPPPPPPVYYNPAWTEAHVEWCIARYRSYNPATNTFIGYDGYQHACVGPY